MTIVCRWSRRAERVFGSDTARIFRPRWSYRRLVVGARPSTLRLRVIFFQSPSVGKDKELLGITLHFIAGYNEPEIVQEEELELQLVEFRLWQTADLDAVSKRGKENTNIEAYFGIPRIGVEDVAEKLARDGNTGNDKAVYVV